MVWFQMILLEQIQRGYVVQDDYSQRWEDNGGEEAYEEVAGVAAHMWFWMAMRFYTDGSNNLWCLWCPAVGNHPPQLSFPSFFYNMSWFLDLFIRGIFYKLLFYQIYKPFIKVQLLILKKLR
jgi:hypothetical protein